MPSSISWRCKLFADCASIGSLSCRGVKVSLLKQLIGDSAGRSRVLHFFLICYCLSAALSIALSQIFLAGALFFWLAGYLPMLTRPQNPDGSAYRRLLAVPMLNLFLVSFISSLFGVDLARSFLELLKTWFYLLLPFCVFDIVGAAKNTEEGLKRIKVWLGALLISQFTAALHTMFAAAAHGELPPKIPGPVTESGQLVLVLPMIIGFSLVEWRDNASNRKSNLFRQAVILILAVVFGWADRLPWYPLPSFVSEFRIACGLTLLALLLPSLLSARELLHLAGGRTERFLTAAAPLLFSALLLNLKRGPWVGVFVAVVVIGLVFSRRMAVSAVMASIFSVILLSPVRARLFAFINDFVIHGGRKSMWTLGMELVERFPLGIGFGNARFMRVLDPSLPILHRHMHNNLLNVAVELGLLGLVVYIWWIVTAVKLGFDIWKRSSSSSSVLIIKAGIFSFVLAAALLGWQIAGFVEYNFGDGEVRLIAFLYMGVILGLGQLVEREERESA